MFVLAAVILGGGGSSAPLSELLTQWTAIAAGLFYALQPGAAHGPGLPRTAIAFGALLLVVPLLQIIPLPPALWQDLPGRAAEREALALIGRADAWMPWSMAPAMTLASLLSLAPPLVAMAYGAGTGSRGRGILIAAVAVGGVLSLILGALQLADGDAGRTWRFYDDNPGFLNGFQANRNAEADLLLIAALAAAATARLLAPARGRSAIRSGAAVCAALLIGCVMTGSRAGIVLSLPVAALAGIIIEPRLRSGRAIFGVMVLGLAPFAFLVLALLLKNQALQSVAGRFTFQHDVRLDLWQDTWTAIRSSWPWGTGVGTFRTAFLAAERLAVVDATRPVRAHNEYLEFLLEGGIAAIIVAGTCAVLLGRGIFAARGAVRRDEMPHLLWALGTLALTALHSLVDYPLRSMSLAIVNAVAAGVIFAIARENGRASIAQGGSHRRIHHD